MSVGLQGREVSSCLLCLFMAVLAGLTFIAARVNGRLLQLP